MRATFLTAFLPLLTAGAAMAQSVEATMPVPIIGNGQAGSQILGGNDAPMTDGMTPKEKHDAVMQAVRIAVARDELAKEEAAKKAAEQKARGAKAAGTAQSATPQTTAPAAEPAPVRRGPNPEDQILQQMR